MLALNKDGTATLTFPHKTIQLKMPVLEEYGDIMDVVEDTRFQIVVLNKQTRAARIQAVATADPEAFAEIRISERKVEDIRAVFVMVVVEKLGGENFDSEEARAEFKGQLPRWVVGEDFMARILNHWETVPFPGPGQ